jgi:hypothetical protein
MRLISATLAISVLLIAASPEAASAHGWPFYVHKAAAYAEGRAGSPAFAVEGSRGRLHGHRVASRYPSASVLKVMFLVAYLRRPSVRHRDLRRDDKNLLAPMIKRSDNNAATRVANIVGPRAMNRLAADAHMKDFSYTRPWGLSQISARDQARFMFRLERYIPDRHETYALYLLSHVIGPQRWGMAAYIDERLPDWDLFFKGGWGSGTGWVDHQVAFIQKNDRRVAVAVLTHDNPNHAYGIHTERVVARLLLRHLR